MAAEGLPWGYRWRSSKTFITLTATLGLFTEAFLYGFIVPILSYMIEVRLHLPPSGTQRIITALLTLHGFVALISSPIYAHFLDKTTSRRIPLLLALLGCIAGTLLMASATSMAALFVGRTIQASAGAAGFILGFGILTDTFDPKHVGKVFGIGMSFLTAGLTLGPATAGALLQWAGYWSAWSVPLALLAIDVVLRLAMIQNNDKQRTSLDEDQDPLLGHPDSGSEHSDSKSSPGFYRIVLTDVRILVGVLNTITYASMISGFDTTLPLHLQREFKWGTFWVGMNFLGLQIPGIILSPLTGWLRDRVGFRYPTTLGWILLALLLWLLGVPGLQAFRQAASKDQEKALYVAGILGIGAVIPLVRDAGLFQNTTVTNDMKHKNPNIFGTHGGTSRVYSITEMAFNFGILLGPLLCGTLADAFGFYLAVFVFGVLSLIVALLSFVFFAREKKERQ